MAQSPRDALTIEQRELLQRGDDVTERATVIFTFEIETAEHVAKSRAREVETVELLEGVHSLRRTTRARAFVRAEGYMKQSATVDRDFGYLPRENSAIVMEL